MRDHELFTLVRAALLSQVPAGWGVIQAFQPTGQGAHSAPTLYFFKSGEALVGTPHKVEVWNGVDYDHAERQQVRTTLRFQAVVHEEDPDGTLSSADMAAEAGQYLQSDATRTALHAAHVGGLRVVQLPGLQITDQSDQYLRTSSLDFEVVYSRVIVAKTPAARMGDVQLHAV